MLIETCKMSDVDPAWSRSKPYIIVPLFRRELVWTSVTTRNVGSILLRVPRSCIPRRLEFSSSVA